MVPGGWMGSQCRNVFILKKLKKTFELTFLEQSRFTWKLLDIVQNQVTLLKSRWGRGGTGGGGGTGGTTIVMKITSIHLSIYSRKNL
jgi:hypothetical protein